MKQTANTNLPEYITAKEICQILKCSLPTAYGIIHSKMLSTMRIKIGRSYRIDQEKFLKLIENGYEF